MKKSKLFFITKPEVSFVTPFTFIQNAICSVPCRITTLGKFGAWHLLPSVSSEIVNDYLEQYHPRENQNDDCHD